MSASVLRGGIRPLLFPRSVAVVGASDRTPEAAADLEQVLRGGVPTWFVNPNRPAVLGRECFPALTELPETPECAYLLVGHTRAEAAFEDVIAAGVRSVVLPGLGAEAGAAGARSRRASRCAPPSTTSPSWGRTAWASRRPAACRCGSARSPAPRRSCPATSPASRTRARSPRRSWPQARASASARSSRPAASSPAISPTSWRTWPPTTARRRSASSSRRSAGRTPSRRRSRSPPRPGKPVVCLKVGRSQAAARAALAHSGAVVGSARAFSALLRRHDALEVSDFHELLETLEVLGRKRWPRGLRIAAVSESGGECGLLADHGEEAGIPFAPFGDALKTGLIEAFPNYTLPENPLDCWAIDEAARVYPGSLALLRDSGGYDVLLAQVDVSRHRGEHDEEWCSLIVEALADAVEGSGIFPAVTTVHATDPPPAIAELATRRDIALLRGTREGLAAIAAVARWDARRPKAAAAQPPPLTGDPLPAGALPEHDSCALLERYGVGFPPRERCATPQRPPRPSNGSAALSSSRSTGRRTSRRPAAWRSASRARRRRGRQPSAWAAECSWRVRWAPASRRSAASRATPTSAPCSPSASAGARSRRSASPQLRSRRSTTPGPVRSWPRPRGSRSSRATTR